MTAQEYYNPASHLPPGDGPSNPARPHVRFHHSSPPPPQYQSFPPPNFPSPHSSNQQLQHYPQPPPPLNTSNSGDMKYGWQPGQPQQSYPPPAPHQRPVLSSLQTQPPYPTTPYQQSEYAQAPNPYPAHLRPQRSYSEPPSPSTSNDDDSDYRRRDSYSSRHYPSRHSHPSEQLHSSRHHLHRHEPTNAQVARGMPKSTNSTNTFLGAFGGGAIGDLIFPGLGTLGGALLGGLGGHEIGKKDTRSRSFGAADRRGRKRDRYDEEWEEGRRRRGETREDDY